MNVTVKELPCHIEACTCHTTSACESTLYVTRGCNTKTRSKDTLYTSKVNSNEKKRKKK